MSFGSVLIAIIYVWLLKKIVKPMLYISMFLILVFLLLLGGWAWIKKASYDPVKEEKNYNYAYAGAIGAWVFAGIYACFMCCCWKNISLGASIMEAASDFVSQNLRVVLLPILSFIISFVFFVFWIFTAMYIYSIGTAEFSAGSPIANIKWDE
jgi:solute carrier family 44 protein 1 (choline transporter-like protein)